MLASASPTQNGENLATALQAALWPAVFLVVAVASMLVAQRLSSLDALNSTNPHVVLVSQQMPLAPLGADTALDGSGTQPRRNNEPSHLPRR